MATFVFRLRRQKAKPTEKCVASTHRFCDNSCGARRDFRRRLANAPPGVALTGIFLTAALVRLKSRGNSRATTEGFTALQAITFVALPAVGYV